MLNRPITVYKRPKKATVSLTSLLDLLFVMIFVSLIQQKNITPVEKSKTPKKSPAPVKVVKKTKTVTPVKVPKIYSVSALFYFYGTAQNPNIPTGSYRMQGKYDEKSGQLSLGGMRWVNRPKDYDMVPLSGKISADKKLFTGRIEFYGCKEFTLRRVGQGRDNPISGTWEGVYDCSQGPTGLTLTID